MMFFNLLFVCTLCAVITVVYASFFEWTLHKYFMHRPVGSFDYAFRAHALTHHQKFKADHTYHLINEADKETIPMAWWNGPVLIGVASVPFVVVGVLTGHWKSIPATGLLVICSYYGAYEYLHWCMHLPKRRSLEGSRIFFLLNGHHLLHHRYMHRNFNVVFPLADLCLGTLRLRADTHFEQVKGPSVPDVQPRRRPRKLALA